VAEDRPCIRRCPTLKFRNAHAFTQKKDAETPGTTAEATPKSPFNPMIQVPWNESAREREREQRALERADRRERERERERERASERERERERACEHEACFTGVFVGNASYTCTHVCMHVHSTYRYT